VQNETLLLEHTAVHLGLIRTKLDRLAAMDKIPLNYEASEGDTHKRQTSTLPTEVVQCLENARFVRPDSQMPKHVKMLMEDHYALTELFYALFCKRI
jgi:hypothetical protein